MRLLYGFTAVKKGRNDEKKKNLIYTLATLNISNSPLPHSNLKLYPWCTKKNTNIHEI